MLEPDWIGTAEDLRKTTVKWARPVSTFDGEGTAESVGAFTEIDVGIQVHENETYAVFDATVDIQVGDLLIVT